MEIPTGPGGHRVWDGFGLGILPRRYRADQRRPRYRSSAFTHFESSTAPLSVNHQGQFPVVTISFNLAPKASLGDATTAIDKAEQEIGMPLSVQAAFQGTAASFQASLEPTSRC